jgi:hypothetical protein
MPTRLQRRQRPRRPRPAPRLKHLAEPLGPVPVLVVELQAIRRVSDNRINAAGPQHWQHAHGVTDDQHEAFGIDGKVDRLYDGNDRQE